MTEQEVKILEDLVAAADKARPVLNKHKHDARFTTFPVQYGERVVMVTFESGIKKIEL